MLRPDREAQVREMIATIERESEYVQRLTGLRSIRKRVLEAMAEVPREEFVLPEMQAFAFENRALPIEAGQTISQPFIVALMTDLLEPEPEDVILEVGTGSGYQAAILSQLVKKVYSLEVIPDLSAEADLRLERLGYDNVEVRTGDGYNGWPDVGPFDGIIVTAAAPHIPQPLINQLKPHARLVIPVGSPGLSQDLMLVTKGNNGGVRQREILSVAFVPLTGRHGPGGTA